MSDKKETIMLQMPESFTFGDLEADDFDRVLSFFDWSLKDKFIFFDFEQTKIFDSCRLALLILFQDFIIRKGCEIVHSTHPETRKIWTSETTTSNWKYLNEIINENAKTANPTLIINDSQDCAKAIEFAKRYTENFDIEYEKTLRYVLNELLSNTLDHGRNGLDVPALLQFFWNEELKEISFIVADVGIGIKNHLRQSYPSLVTDTEAILQAIKPKVSGTFGRPTSNYGKINNAGLGLFFSSNFAQKLKADMFIVSGNGFVHISPNEIISKELRHQWKGTFVYVKMKLGLLKNLSFEEMRLEIQANMPKADVSPESDSYYINLKNYFGIAIENKDLAKKIRDNYLLPALAENKTITIDFEDIVFATDSVLNAMLATPIRQLGLAAYKKIKVINLASDIRVMVDFIFDDNTSNA